MNELVFHLKRAQYRPGDTVRGTFRWRQPNPYEALELKLRWFTSGKGARDSGVVRSIRFVKPGCTGERSFHMPLPVEAYSFSGQLISLTWALELTQGGSRRQVEITISPSGREIYLPLGA